MAAVPSDLARKHAIVIDKDYVGSGGVSDFSVLITRDHLDDEVVDPSGSNAARTDGGDVRFSSDSDGDSMLYADVISFEHDSDSAEGDADVQIRVKVSSLSSSANTTIYVWYDGSTTTAQPAANAAGGSDGAYDSNWVGYWPLEEDPSTTDAADRTANGYDATPSSMESSDLKSFGQIGNCWEMYSPELADAGNISELYDATEMTLMMWADRYYGSDTGMGIGFGSTAGRANILIYNDGKVYWQIGSTSYPNCATTGNGFKHYALAYDGSQSGLDRIDAYIDGSEQTLTAGGSDPAAALPASGSQPTFYIGPRYKGGMHDEAQLHSVKRSAAWITTEYNQTNSPSTFASAGTPGDAGGGTTEPERGPFVKPFSRPNAGGFVA